jgi:hypothetical protein
MTLCHSARGSPLVEEVGAAIPVLPYISGASLGANDHRSVECRPNSAGYSAMSVSIAYQAADNYDVFNDALAGHYGVKITGTGHGFGQRLVRLSVTTDVLRSDVHRIAEWYGIEVEAICMVDRTDIRVTD